MQAGTFQFFTAIIYICKYAWKIYIFLNYLQINRIYTIEQNYCSHIFKLTAGSSAKDHSIFLPVMTNWRFL